MAWVETESLSFLARHETADAASAERVLDALEDLRLDLEERFARIPEEMTIVVHASPLWLSVAHPFLPMVRWASAPAGRRYLAGWATRGELHVLADDDLVRRAAGDESREALLRTAERLYAQVVIALNAEGLPPPWGARSFARYLRWAWLVEGAGQHFSNQTPLFRPAVVRRLREGAQPSFPPGPRDAAVLGGTVFELLERQRGTAACGLLVSRLRAGGPLRALELAFERSAPEIEVDWREHLRGPDRRPGTPDPDDWLSEP